jgi:Flp pilus assembly protein TadD
LKRRDEAVREFETLAAMGVPLPDVYLELGNEYITDNRLEAATDMLVKAATQAPARPDIRIALGRLYRLKGLLADAERQLAQAFPESSSVEASGFYEQAQADLNREVGILRFEQKRVDEAVDALGRAVSLEPTDGVAHRYLAEAYVLAGKHDLAATHAARAAEAGVVVPDQVRAAIAARSHLEPK